VPVVMLLHVFAVAAPISSLIATMILLTNGVVASKNRICPRRGRTFLSRWYLYVP
jgi:hypothetical protein